MPTNSTRFRRDGSARADDVARFAPGTGGEGPLDRDSEQPLFEQVAARIEAAIRSGAISPGERVPSVRRAKSQFAVSVSTVVEAYRLLEAKGVIRARPQSGYFVREPLQRTEAAPPRMSPPPLRSVAVGPQEPGLLRFRAAVPDPELLPTARLGSILARVVRDRPDALAAYGPASGASELRREIARRMLDAGCVVSPDELIVTNGATEAVSLALQAISSPGDTIAVECPTYHGLLDTLRARGLRALPLASCTIDGVSVSAFRRAVETETLAAAVVVPTFSNPLGGLLPVERKRELLEIAREHGVPIIEDDIYGELGFSNDRPPALRSFDGGEHVLYCSSFSKTLAPGLRIGWLAPGKRFEQCLALKHDLNVATPLAPQLAIAEFLAGRAYDRHLRALRRHYETQVARFTDRVLATFPSGVRLSQPRGGHVLWIELPEAVDAHRLLDESVARGITFAPGSLFSPTEGCYRNFMRLNCAVPWSDRVADAIATIGAIANRQVAVCAGRGVDATDLRNRATPTRL